MISKKDIKRLHVINNRIKKINTERHKILPFIRNSKQTSKQQREFDKLGEERSKLKLERERIYDNYNK